jgi:hypothetical protein
MDQYVTVVVTFVCAADCGYLRAACQCMWTFLRDVTGEVVTHFLKLCSLASNQGIHPKLYEISPLTNCS